MTGLLNLQPFLDELLARSSQVSEARSKCLEVIQQNFESGGDIAATVAGRLERYRDAKNDHAPELVQKAQSVESEVTSWLPVLIAVQGIVASVSVNQFLTVARSAIAALLVHGKAVEQSRSNIERISSLAEELGIAQTTEARLQILMALSDNDLKELHGDVTDIPKKFNEELTKLQQLVERDIAAETEIAETFNAVREFLEARQHVLENYLKATNYFSGLEPKEHTSREATWESAKEAAKIGIEFVATKAGPKILQQVPGVGIVFAGADIVLEMRKKREEFRRRAEELRTLATAHEARGATDEIFDLGRSLTADVKRLAELKALVEQLEEWLGGLVEKIGDSHPPSKIVGRTD